MRTPIANARIGGCTCRANRTTPPTMPTNSSRGRVSTYSLKTGTTAVESAPSASRRRSMFGIRKATKNASVTGPAPKTSATTMSRTNPSTRERNVAPLMDPSARTTWRSTLMALTSSTDHCPGNRGTDTASCGVHISTREESQVGEHQVGHETKQAEREPPDPQPYRSLQGPDRGQDGAHGRHRGGRPP